MWEYDALAENSTVLKEKLSEMEEAYNADLNFVLRYASVSGSKTILKDGAVKLKYKGASTGENEYISAIIEDTEGNILYYGNIAGNAADGADSGKAALNVPLDLTPGNYKLLVFSEQSNGDFETDLASNIVTLDITISSGPSRRRRGAAFRR